MSLKGITFKIHQYQPQVTLLEIRSNNISIKNLAYIMKKTTGDNNSLKINNSKSESLKAERKQKPPSTKQK